MWFIRIFERNEKIQGNQRILTDSQVDASIYKPDTTCQGRLASVYFTQWENDN